MRRIFYSVVSAVVSTATSPLSSATATAAASSSSSTTTTLHVPLVHSSLVPHVVEEIRVRQDFGAVDDGTFAPIRRGIRSKEKDLYFGFLSGPIRASRPLSLSSSSSLSLSLVTFANARLKAPPLVYAYRSYRWNYTGRISGGITSRRRRRNNCGWNGRLSVSGDNGVVCRHAADLNIAETYGSSPPVDDDDGSLESRKYDVEILSHDPMVYIVKDVLSPEECRAYIDRASSLSTGDFGEDKDEDDNDKKQDRSMTRSNAPEVSLDASRLWPLPFLCLGAGIPPAVHLYENLPDGAPSPSLAQILSATFPSIVIATLVASSLAWLVTALVRRTAQSSFRTSEAVAFNSDLDVQFVRPLVDRVCSASVLSATGGHSWRAYEAPVVTRYRPGAVFARHNDASPTKGAEWSDEGGQRVVTVICYLNTCAEGGGTRFDRLGLTVQPKEGSALVFFPADRVTLEADDRTRHESLPAVEEKWIVQFFGRVGPRVPPPLGLPDSFGNDT